MKTAERDMARRLRREEGLSIRDIERRLGVARSSVSLWVRDIELTREQQEALLARNRARTRQLAGNAIVAAKARHRRASAQKQGRLLAGSGDPLHVAGCMLFWAEGSKNRNKVELANSDPDVLRLFLRFLRTYFQVPDEKVRIWCNLFADHVERQREIEQFWLTTLGLPRSCLRKSAVNIYSRYTKKKRTNKLPYGTCTIILNSTQIAQHLYGAIQEYGGFDRPEWLD
jgi:AcrR family transcriptional regulator